MERINFFSEETDFVIDQPPLIINWLEAIAKQENQEIDTLNYVFCSDEYLLKINRDYLQHDYYTDIITFDNRDGANDPIESDIFVSIDRVMENASEQNIPFENELKRVLAHGLLHLLGFNDKTVDQQKVMREKEEAYLSLQFNN